MSLCLRQQRASMSSGSRGRSWSSILSPGISRGTTVRFRYSVGPSARKACHSWARSGSTLAPFQIFSIYSALSLIDSSVAFIRQSASLSRSSISTDIVCRPSTPSCCWPVTPSTSATFFRLPTINTSCVLQSCRSVTSRNPSFPLSCKYRAQTYFSSSRTPTSSSAVPLHTLRSWSADCLAEKTVCSISYSLATRPMVQFLQPFDPSNFTAGELFLPLQQGCSPKQNALNQSMTSLSIGPWNTTANSFLVFLRQRMSLQNWGSSRYLPYISNSRSRRTSPRISSLLSNYAFTQSCSGFTRKRLLLILSTSAFSLIPGPPAFVKLPSWALQLSRSGASFPAMNLLSVNQRQLWSVSSGLARESEGCTSFHTTGLFSSFCSVLPHAQLATSRLSSCSTYCARAVKRIASRSKWRMSFLLITSGTSLTLGGIGCNYYDSRDSIIESGDTVIRMQLMKQMVGNFRYKCEGVVRNFSQVGSFSVLGQRLGSREDCYCIFAKIIWITYRSGYNFPFSGGRSITSDTGWGCVIRVGQMLLAQSLKRMLMHEMGEVDSQDLINVILSFVEDQKRGWNGEYSLSRIVRVAEEEWGYRPGSWMNPYSIGKSLQKLSKNLKKKGFQRFEIQAFNQVVSKSVLSDCLEGHCECPSPQQFCSRCCRLTRKLLIMVSTMVGITCIQKEKVPQLQALMDLSSFCGAIGGRGDRALFLVGITKHSFLYLDPHFTQPKVDIGDRERLVSEFFCKEVREVAVTELKSSLSFGYFFNQVEEIGQFVRTLKRLHQNFIGIEEESLTQSSLGSRHSLKEIVSPREDEPDSCCYMDDDYQVLE